MKLLQAGPSPFARMCRVAIAEAGLAGVEVVEVQASPVDTPADVAAANPVGKIPVLVREDGPAIFDSRVICRFVDARAGARLYPEARLWEVLTLEAMGHGIAEAAVLMVYQQRHGGTDSSGGPHWTDGQWDKVERALGAAEARWLPVLEGPVHMGQVAMGCALGYLDLRHGERGWRDHHSALAAWFERFAGRASMRATAPA